MLQHTPTVVIENSSTHKLTHYYFCSGLPLPRGTFHLNTTFELVDGQRVPMSDIAFSVQTLWPDNSVKWLVIEGTVELDAGEVKRLHVVPNEQPLQLSRLSPIKDSGRDITIQTAAGNIDIHRHQLLSFTMDTLHCEPLSLALEKDEGTPLLFEANSTYTVIGNPSKDVLVKIVQHGQVQRDQDTLLHAHAEITCVLETGDLYIECSVTNPKPACHDEGKWDLGDENSLHISWVKSKFTCSEKPLAVHGVLNGVTEHSQSEGNWLLFQASSGQNNWRSPVHVNKDNQVTLPYKGFKLTADETLIAHGDTAEPIICLGSGTTPRVLEIENFWQNFPAAAGHNDGQVWFSLLGGCKTTSIELQPGEQKTRNWMITQSSARRSQVSIAIDPAYVVATQCLFPLLDDQQSASAAQLIAQGVCGNDSFTHKRQAIDMYGWRHFGELYADHEKALDPDNPNFVSHYNNQYDPIFGMLLQWLKTGEYRWFTLADQLAKHVADIDVYHTENDKPEYSGGLFWHTDHYVEAYTATHRTYSKLQPSNVYDDHAGSGGPGGQHCYTQGLTLHYLLTQYQPSKRAVDKLSHWIETLYEGDGTLLSLILSIKNRHRVDLKNVMSGHYPLDRGTANYIHGLLDRFELNGDESVLRKVEHIALSTISAADDIAKRNLDDAENTWFYTVLLQALCRYLTLMVTHYPAVHSAATTNIVAALRHYSNWMIDNEALYLDSPQNLEFPNQTWTGQDLRKLCVLSFVLPFLDAQAEQKAREKHQKLNTGIFQNLTGHPESSSTRLLCLLMQNAHWHDYAYAGQLCAVHFSKHQSTDVVAHSLDTLWRTTLKTLKHFSLAYELNQAVKRFPFLTKWLGRPRHG